MSRKGNERGDRSLFEANGAGSRDAVAGSFDSGTCVSMILENGSLSSVTSLQYIWHKGWKLARNVSRHTV